MKKKKQKERSMGTLPERESFAPEDHRGTKREKGKKPDSAKAPDGISGDW